MKFPKPSERAYNYACSRYRMYGYDWQLTLTEWQTFWTQGDYTRRGAGVDKYNLRRRDPKGPYSVDNCYMEYTPRTVREPKPRPLPREGVIRTHNGVRTLTVKQWLAEVRAARQPDC